MSSREDWSISTALCLQLVAPALLHLRAGLVLAMGIDWAEEFHLVASGRPGEGVFEVRRVEHSPGAIDALVGRVAALEPDPAEVRVVLETRHGLLVERLLDAGHTVVPVNPDLVARRRVPANKKGDAEDARIACLLALDRFERLRPLLAHGAQRRARERRMGELLLGAPRRGRARTPRPEEAGEGFPGGEIDDRPCQLESPNALRCYAGKSPLSRRSGKSERVVSCRRAYNRHLGDAVRQWAFCSLKRSTWTREFCDVHRAKGKGHHAALRALGDRWLEVLWHCLREGVLHDEDVHAANRERALEPLAQAA